MLAPCLHDLSKHDLKQVPEGAYRNLNSLPSPNERTISAGWWPDYGENSAWSRFPFTKMSLLTVIPESPLSFLNNHHHSVANYDAQTFNSNCTTFSVRTCGNFAHKPFSGTCRNYMAWENQYLYNLIWRDNV